jgi:malate dehydrogenase (oxaloacetate-decarboxylating)
MKRFELRVDPLTNEIYYDVHLAGRALLQDPLLNKGHAFPHDERAEFELVGLMPDSVGSLEDQIARDYDIFKSKTTDLERYVNLAALRDRNETIYFAMLTRHIEEMLPIVYTPTVGLACLKLSHILRRYRGVYISPNTVNYTEQMLRNVGLPNISLIVVTDGERILGYGDLGADGMGIPIGKIALYIAAAGIHPASTLPICIDVGTNNEQLLKDPLYLGIKKNRLRGDAYFEVIERFIQGVKRIFPRALLQWEDFGKEQAFVLLDRYKERLPSFNDDMQGTGAVAAAALRTTSRINCRPLSQEQIVIYGFGQAGSGVANAIANQIHSEEGISIAEARKHIWPVDKFGLLLNGMNVEPYQIDFVHPREDIASWSVDKSKSPSLAEVVYNSKATILIGLSAQPGAFDKALLTNLAANTKRPVIFTLSNPTSRSETTAAAVMEATGGRALIASGSPFPPVTLPDGRTAQVSQCNNLYVFPGMGLGAIVCQASRVTPTMFAAASRAVSEMVTQAQMDEGCLLPPLTNVRDVSYHVALAVAKQARDEGLGLIASDERLAELIKSAMWVPRYYPYRRNRA